MSDDSVLNLNTASLQKYAEVTPYVDTTGSVISNETITVTEDDTFDSNTISAGGIINIEDGAYATGNSFYNGAVLNVSTGGMAATNEFYSGATCIIDTDGISVMDVIHDGASMVVNGGIISELSVSGGNVTLEANAYMDNGKIFSGGSLIANSGAIIDSLTVNSGASATIVSGAFISSLDTTSTAASTITVAAGGTLTLDPSVGGVVNMATGSGTNLIISASDAATTGTTTVINGLSGSTSSAKLTLAGVTSAEIASIDKTTTANQVTFTLTNGQTITLNITGADQINFENSSTDANGNIVFEACFLAGTMINTGDSVCAVEDLKIGDTVMTYDWQTQQNLPRSITWVGKKHVHVNPSLSDDQAGYPVRILQHAIAHNVPNKDLLITPEHSLFFEDKFIPARMLVNGHSIYYDYSITSYDYYHIETENHSVIYADGMMTESFLDTGNRKIFTQKGKITSLSVLPAKSWEHDAAASLVVSQDNVEPIYRHIEQRAREMSAPRQSSPIQLTDDAGIHLITNKGQSIYNYAVQDGKIIFILPSDTQFVKIMSRVGRPNETIGSFIDDRRYLGVLIGEITVSTQASHNNPITIHHHMDYLNGWDVKEGAAHRWTKGNAMLPLNPVANTQTPMLLSIQILAGGPYFVDIPEITKKTA